MTQPRKNIGDLNGGWALLFRISLVILPLCFALVSWLAVCVMDNGREIAKIQANRFTSKDGLQVWKEIGEIKAKIAQMPTEVPPSWFLERVNKIDERLSSIEDKLHDIKLSQ